MRLLTLITLSITLIACTRAGFRASEGETWRDGGSRERVSSDLVVTDQNAGDQNAGDQNAGDQNAGDQTMPDVLAPPSKCPAKDNDTLLLFSFSQESTDIQNEAGNHVGKLTGNGGARFLPGPEGCGKALVFADSPTDVVELAASSDWQLKSGSVDFWLRLDSGGTDRGIISRDASRVPQPGHFTIYQLADDGIAVRIQTNNNDSRFAQCSDPISRGQWHHIGVNFGVGGLEFFIDGVRATRKGSYQMSIAHLECGQLSETGIDGNNLNWILGANASNTPTGTNPVIDHPFHGAIDHFRISSVRRNFTKP